MRKHRILFLTLMLLFTVFLLGNTPSQTHVVNSFESLPETTGDFDTRLKTGLGEIGEATLIRASNSGWDITIKVGDDQYLIKNVNLPYNKLRHNVTNGFYWTKEINGVVNRFLVYSTDGAMSSMRSVEAAVEAGDFKPFQIWTVWNVTTGNHETQEKLKVFGAVKKEGSNYSLDVALNVPTDDLMSITIDYSYSEKILWLFKGKSDRIRYTAVLDNYVGYNQNHGAIGFSPKEIAEEFGDAFLEYGIGELPFEKAIQKNVVNLTEKEEFLNRYNKFVFDENKYRAENNLPASDWKSVASVDDIFVDDHLYNIPLRQASSFFTTNLSITDVAIIDLIYRYQGVTYHVAYDDIETYIPDYIERNWTEEIQFAIRKFWSDNKKWVIIIAAALGVGVIAYVALPFIARKPIPKSKPKKKSRKRK